MHASRPYGIPIFDDLHYYLPALLYDSRRFTTVQSVLGYVRAQARQHLDIFSREQRTYRQPSQQAAAAPVPENNVVDALLRGIFAQQPVQIPMTMDFTIPAGTLGHATIFDLLNAPVPGFMNPVPVRATQMQIDANSEVVAAAEMEEGLICSICQDALRLAQLRRLRHCRHTFHRACIDTWFTSHVQCPECRHDIREP